MIYSLFALCAAALFSLAATAQTQPKGAATALELNPEGIGHLLVVPYFSTQGGNATLLSIVNTTTAGKAIKVRFRGAGNADDLFSFQLFLWRNDAWTVNISAGVDGLPVLTTADRSCTLPAAISGRKLSTARLNPSLSGDALHDQAREGYIEIIAMGDVPEGTALRTAITPSLGTPPCTPSVLDSLARFDAQLAPPTTGLIANWVLINVPQTTTWMGAAAAYEARHSGAPSTGNVVFFPQTDVALTAADVTGYTSDPLYNFALGGPIIPPTSSSLPDLSTPYTAATTSAQDQATELSYEIAILASVVEYITEASIAASTDWVVAMPTRRYHTAVDYRGPNLLTNHGTFGDTRSIFFRNLRPNLSTSGQSCYQAIRNELFEGYDREGRGTTSNAVPSPVVTYCGVIPVFSLPSAVGSALPPLQASATRIRLDQPDPGTNGFVRLRWGSEGSKGMPILVQQFSRAANPQAAPGVSGTYGATWPGRTAVRGVPQ